MKKSEIKITVTETSLGLGILLSGSGEIDQRTCMVASVRAILSEYGNTPEKKAEFMADVDDAKPVSDDTSELDEAAMIKAAQDLVDALPDGPFKEKMQGEFDKLKSVTDLLNELKRTAKTS